MTEQLAILPAGNTTIFLWSAANREVQKIETEFKVRSGSIRAWPGPAHKDESSQPPQQPP